MILSYLFFFNPFVDRQSLRQPVDGCGGAGAEQGRWRCALQISQDSRSHISSCVVLFTPVALTFFVYSCPWVSVSEKRHRVSRDYVIT